MSDFGQKTTPLGRGQGGDEESLISRTGTPLLVENRGGDGEHEALVKSTSGKEVKGDRPESKVAGVRPKSTSQKLSELGVIPKIRDFRSNNLEVE
jgi:hypothetical protein